MQMRVDGDDSIDQAVQKAANDALADGLAGMKLRVLAHVAQIGRNQDKAPRTGVAQRRGGEHQFHELRVGVVKRAVEDHRIGHVADADKTFPVGKTACGDLRERNRQCRGEAAGLGRRFRKPLKRERGRRHAGPMI